ncbi:MAG TPA: hypothetical protein VL285_00415, partial [Bryobacteraceae bacterium]|nr:hypothetical protein [Bryobacteraceae bacterium]
KGPGALPPDKQKTIDAFFVKQYNTFHGADDKGLQDLRALAIANPLPPPGFELKNKNQIEAENQQKFAAENPQLALWVTIKDQLAGANGEQYFESSVKGAALPGGANGVTKFKGKLISQKPATKPTSFVLAMGKEDTPAVTVNLDKPMATKAPEGAEIQFEGVATSFTKEPFMLTFDAEKDKIEGWPAPPAPVRRPPVRKKK